MATLQKFKLLATQCAVAGSPTRSPTASPVIHLRRRRRTLLMLLSRGGGSGRRRLPRQDNCGSSPDRHIGDSDGEGKELVVSHKLKDLFVSSSPPSTGEKFTGNIREGLLSAAAARGGIGGGSPLRRIGSRSLRPLSATFRQRLLRRAWRPVLMAIPE